MERYSRAYRDPKSPLTPIAPLKSSTIFNFDFDGDNALKCLIEKIEFHTPGGSREKLRTPKRFSDGFVYIRDIFEKQQGYTTEATKTKVKTEYRKATPKRLSTSKSVIPSHSIKKEPHESPPRRDIFLEVPKVIASLPEQVQHIVEAHRKLLPELQHIQRSYKKHFSKLTSPVRVRPLSPRIAKMLIKTGMTHYQHLFQKEEIDMNIFRTLTPKDLISLGITDAEDQKKILNVIRFAYEHF